MAMEATSTAAVTTVNVTAWGWRMRATEDLASSTAISRMRPATARPETYSSRPWPKGWS